LTKSLTSFAAGAVFPFVFFLANDPDRVALPVVAIWFFAILFPAAWAICAARPSSFLRNAATTAVMHIGMFAGTCAAIIVYTPDRANLFPIAAAIWTIAASVPIVSGAIFGTIFKRTAKEERPPA